MAKTEKKLANPVLSQEAAEQLKLRTAAVAKRRPKMAEERRARIAALKGRRVENVPGQDVDDFFALTEDIDSREELVAKYYAPNLGKLGHTVDTQLKEETANHKAEQEADKKELEALFEDYGGRDVVLEAVLRRKELREKIGKLSLELGDCSVEEAKPDDITSFVHQAVDSGVIEEGPGPVVWGGKPYVSRVEADGVVKEFIEVLVAFITKWQAESEKIREARREKTQRYVFSKEELVSVRTGAEKLRDFLDGARKDAHCLLSVRGTGKHDNKQSFYAGDVLLEKDGREIVCRKVTTERLARMLFFYTARDGEHKQKDELRFEVRGRDFSRIRSSLLREAMEEELKMEKQADEKRRTANRLLDVSSVETPITFAELKDGVKGVCPVDVVMRINERYTPLTFHLEGDGEGKYRIADAVPGTSAKHSLLEKAGGWQPLSALNNKWWGAVERLNDLEKDVLFEQACREFGAKKILDVKQAELFFDLEKGHDGLYALRGTFGRQNTPVAYIIERTGPTIKVRWALPGDATKLLFGAGGKEFNINNLPLSTVKKPVTIRTLLRVLFLQNGAEEAEVPEYLSAKQSGGEQHKPMEEAEQSAATEG